MEGRGRGGEGTRLMLLAGKAGFYPEKGTEYKEVSRLAGGPPGRRGRSSWWLLMAAPPV